MYAECTHVKQIMSVICIRHIFYTIACKKPYPEGGILERERHGKEFPWTNNGYSGIFHYDKSLYTQTEYSLR